MSEQASDEATAVDVAIIGAGFGGLGAAIALDRAGMRDFVVLERGDDVGGTWRANTYPGCQCDIPSNLYSYSFARNADWTHSYPEQPQILDYLRGCARRFGLVDRIRTRCDVLHAAWDGDARRWRVETSTGRVSARVVISASGILSEPVTPALDGLDRFGGAIFHSAAWDHSQDLAGERIALIGTGASAIQIGPRIQPRAARLHVFQRTAPWILPHPDREIPPALRRAYRALPPLQTLARAGVYVTHESLVPGLARAPWLLAPQKLIARWHLERQVSDPGLRARLRPDYPLGCKRVLLSSDWYPMLTEPNVELVTDRIAEVRERSIVTVDGCERGVDAIVFATGFRPTDPPIAARVTGRDGRTLADAWKGSPHAYKSTTVPGFPNLFLAYGPNMNLAHSSIVYMLESQIRYIVDGLRVMTSREVETVEVRADVEAEWNADLQRRLARSVWNGGCASWYIDRNGRNSIMWPGFTFEFRRRLRRFDASSYRAQRAARRADLRAPAFA